MIQKTSFNLSIKTQASILESLHSLSNNLAKARIEDEAKVAIESFLFAKQTNMPIATTKKTPKNKITTTNTKSSSIKESADANAQTPEITMCSIY